MRINYREIPLGRKFGVEYEVSNGVSKSVLGKFIKEYELQSEHTHDVKITAGKTGWAETHCNEYWHVKYDSTCGPLGKGMDSGWEIASFIGCGNQDLEHIAGLADWLHAKGVQTNQNCGLHIHVDARDICQSKMGNLLARWIKIENALALICNPIRWNNPYCRLLCNRSIVRCQAYNPEATGMFWRHMCPTDLSQHNNDDKKYALNTVGYAIGRINPTYDRQTVELRLPECILDTTHVINWVRLILNFVDYVANSDFAPLDLKDVKTLDGLLVYLGLQGFNDFLMLDQPLYDTKIWLLEKIEKLIWFKDSAALTRKFVSQF